MNGARSAVAQIKSEHASRGILNSGTTIIRVFGEVRKEFYSGIEAAFGEQKRAVRKTKLDHQELRQVTVQCLVNFMNEAKAITEWSSFRPLAAEAVDQNLRGFDKPFNFKVRQFDVGFFDPPEPEIPQVSNSINIGSMTGSPIQQGSPNATQEVQMTLNIEAVTNALTTFESAISMSSLSANTISDLMADVQTIRAQLNKPSPSRSILREASKSLRSVLEGVAGGMLTPAIATAASSLWSALGLG
jgi:hypothetical protein